MRCSKKEGLEREVTLISMFDFTMANLIVFMQNTPEWASSDFNLRRGKRRGKED